MMKKRSLLFAVAGLVCCSVSYARHLYIGMQGGYLRNMKMIQSASALPAYLQETDRMQLGLQAQVIITRRINVFAEGIFYQGFSDIQRAPKLYADPRIVNRHMAINIGIRFKCIKN